MSRVKTCPSGVSKIKCNEKDLTLRGPRMQLTQSRVGEKSRVIMRWFLLPGMGATDAMYNGLKHKLGFKVNFLNWPEYRGEKMYADVARRVLKENDIGADDVVGGSSLGGMVALEIAQPPLAVTIQTSNNAFVYGNRVRSLKLRVRDESETV